MKFTLASIALPASFIPSVVANFDVYFIHTNLYDTYNWGIYDAQPSCETVRTTRAWSWRSDVSGDKLGMRCQGSGCAFNAPIENIDVLEMNFNNNPILHWTIYKNRNYDLIGLDGKTYGNCFAYPYGDYDCPGEQGHRKFRCLTSSTASQLNSKK